MHLKNGLKIVILLLNLNNQRIPSNFIKQYLRVCRRTKDCSKFFVVRDQIDIRFFRT
jgi:hypothetical protein